MSNQAQSKWSSPWAFFALTYALTWLFWIPAALTGRSIGEFPVTLLVALGGICPAVCGILLTRLTRDKAGWRDYWLRVIDYRRIGARWYAVIFLLVPALTILVVLMEAAIIGQGVRLEHSSDFLSRPLMVLPSAIFVLFFGPVPEELGWRGYVGVITLPKVGVSESEPSGGWKCPHPASS